MGRMRVSMIAALGIAIAIAMLPRAAYAADYLELDTGNMMVCPIPDYTNAGDYTLDLTLAQNVYPFKPSESSQTNRSGNINTTLTLSGTSTTQLSYSSEDRRLTQNGTFDHLYNFGENYFYQPSYTITTASLGNKWYVDPSGSSALKKINIKIGNVQGFSHGLELDLPGEVGTGSLTGTEALSGSNVGTYSDNGTIYLDRNVGQGYYSCAAPTDGWTGNYCYCFVGYGDVSRGGGAYRQYIANSGESVRFYVPRFTYWIDDVFVNGVTSNGNAANYYGFAYMDETDVTHVVTNVTNTFQLPANARYVGVILRFDKREIQKGSFLVFKPFQMWIKASPIEQTIERETEQQTAELKDTTGSNSIVDTVTGGGTEGFKQKLGFLGQIGDVANTFNTTLSGASENSGIQFPGVVVQGVTLVAPQRVDIWQNGLDSLKQPVKMALTFALVAAWVNGMKRLLDYQLLGEPYSGEVQE